MNKAKVACVTVVLTLVLLSIAVPPASANPGTRLDSLYAYLNTRYDSANEGGYSVSGEVISRIGSTYSALVALDELGYLATRPPLIDLVKTKNFTTKVQYESSKYEIKNINYGGWGDTFAVNATTVTTYQALNLWELLIKHDDIPKMSLLNIKINEVPVFINRTHSVSGGFANRPNGTADVLSTFYALWSLDYVIKKSPQSNNWTTWLPNPDNTTQWILSCMDGNAFKLSPASRVTGVTATAAALMSLKILDKLNMLNNTQGIRDWLLARQVQTVSVGMHVGGFTEGVATNDTNLMSSYFALLGLDALNALELVNATGAIDFILDCQSADGSWGLVPQMTTGKIGNIGIAIKALKMLESNVYGLLLEQDPNHPAPSLVDWRVVVIVAVTATAVIAAVVSVRRD
ncbi:MAG: hypothetical protein HXY34_05055 [Candidatus Thorarchaeota archaeon]|nr:hypothetical protein [Candidatus Thorarchaeota archaeon]